MKKLFLTLPLILLTALGCNPVQQVAQQNPAAKQNSTVPQNGAPADWKKFSFQNFSFQYPPDWQVNDESRYVANGGFQIEVVNTNTSGFQPDEMGLQSIDDRAGTASHYRDSQQFMYSPNGDYIQFTINGTKFYAGCADSLKGQTTLDICNQIVSTLKANPTKAKLGGVTNSFKAQGLQMTLPYDSWSIEKQEDVKISGSIETDTYIKTDPNAKNSPFLVGVEVEYSNLQPISNSTTTYKDLYGNTIGLSPFKFDIPDGQVFGEGCGGCLQANRIKFSDNNKIYGVIFGSTNLPDTGNDNLWSTDDFDKLLKSAKKVQ